jgi:CubicO group peptidase (beta-lactamase class C family)
MSNRYRQRSLGVALGACLIAVAHTAAAIALDDSQRRRIDALFSEFDAQTPGCALGIMSEGRMIYERGYGMATLEPPAAIDSTKVFDIASMSKQFTAASVVLLAQQGRLRLTDNVRKYVPELPDYGTPITINDLIWHTSGLRDYSALLLLGGFDYPDVTTQAQALDFIRRQQRLNFTPGTRYEYSNTGYVLLAIIAERVSRKTMNQLARQQFFDPLAMPQAVFRDRFDLVIPNQALGYAQLSETEWAVFMSNWEQIGDGALQLSLDEFQRWDENFFSGQVGGHAFIAEMHSTGKLRNGRPLIYARGLQVDRYRGLSRVRHGGDWIGYHGNMLRFPGLHTTVALFCNLEGIDQYELSTAVVDIALERQFTEPKPIVPGPAPSLPHERFVGTYFNGPQEEVYSVTTEDGTLVLHYLGIPLPLITTGPTTFTIDGLPGSKGKFLVRDGLPAHAISFVLDTDEPDEAPLQGSRFTPVAPPADLNQFAGTYFSPELGVAWNFIVEEGALALAEDPEVDVLGLAGPVAPANAADTFSSGMYLQFTRNSAGAVNGLKMSFLGMKDFSFEKRAAESGVAALAPAATSSGHTDRATVRLPNGTVLSGRNPARN